MSQRKINVALAGNPNGGKTALFNALTGLHQRVGNWSGVTVDKKTGEFEQAGVSVNVMDLPGTYALHALSVDDAIDHTIACQALLFEPLDCVVNVVDATHLERHLYLTLQLLELGLPVIVALTMTDRLEALKKNIDVQALSDQLGCPVIAVVASKQIGLSDLRQAIVQSRQQAPSVSPVCWPKAVQQAIDHIKHQCDLSATTNMVATSGVILHALEGNAPIQALFNEHDRALLDEQQALIQQTDEGADIAIADARYGCVDEISRSVTTQQRRTNATVTERIDRVVLNRFLGLPLFFGVMYLMFFFAINVAGALQDFFDISTTAVFVDGGAQLMAAMHFPSALIALIAHGVGLGLNTTLTFIPVIGGMFLFLSILEDSGYMSRAALVMDRLMVMLGLPGKSFVPMIVGFGCNVPAVMGARTLSSPRDRILTVMMMPFMSCGARLAIFAVFASAFFPHHGSLLVFMLYVIGVMVAILTGVMLRLTVLPGEVAPLVMTLPDYHWPRLSTMLRYTWQRLYAFISRASRVIIPVCIIVGGLNTITVTGHISTNDADSQSVLSLVGRVVTPVFAPMGLQTDNWPATVGLVTGVMAKEVVVGALNTLYTQQAQLPITSDDDGTLWQQLSAAVMSIPDNLSQMGNAILHPLAANEAEVDVNQGVYGVMQRYFTGTASVLAYLLFILLYFPCVSTMAAMRREIGMKWALFSVGWSTGMAYAVAVCVYQCGTIAQHVGSSVVTLVVIMVVIVGVMQCLSRYSRSSGRAGLSDGLTGDVT